MTIHKEGGWPIIVAALVLFVLNMLLNPFTGDIYWLFYSHVGASLILFGFIVNFFRSPKRDKHADENVIYAPADGKVVVIEETTEDEFLKDRRIQVSIFMSPLNVHIQWAPFSGKVEYFKYHPGKFLVAWHPKSSTHNERTSLVLNNGNESVMIRQIAGAVARRIIWYTKDGKENYDQHEEFGFIRFGSRVDLFLPLDAKMDVKIDDVVTGGLTPIARFQ
jgi:phosphatidylserine decarboxylase